MEDLELAKSSIQIVTDPQQGDGDSGKKSPPSIFTRLHAGYFRISLSFGGQVLLWKTLSEHVYETQAIHFILHIHTFPSMAFLLLWWLSLCILILLSVLYIFKCIFYFNLVKAEFLHHVGVNYHFTPWISWLVFLQTGPFVNENDAPYHILLWVFVVPVVLLDLKIYGQWFTTEKRFLSMVANPTSQISVIGNLVGAWTAARMGWKESAVCIFTLGMAHYLVVFITLYQRLSGANRFPAMLRPVFFLFVAAPSMGSLAWSSISGSFDMPCKMLFFLALFLFSSLICRPALFKKSMKKFNITWWAYSFPLTFLALASAEYAQQVKGVVASAIMLIISAISVLVFLGILIITAVNTDSLLCENDPCLGFMDNNYKT
ncbi:S-type anion channel SLAH1-like [Olea europaea subsp. europaea]|uniref:S-type anion channel SLAH1-like n=1 Tax=Olea europaea subsp. europaea TaxID=158383 RepID=A0A8S0SLG9_OLEEU|nr:S-type anion channel SLAH1-like [Olea europaea subsp. europaea]